MKQLLFVTLLFLNGSSFAQKINVIEPDIVKYDPFVWKSEPPNDIPFKNSKEYTGIKFLGIKSGFHYGDTWYPTWAANDTLYSPWTDGTTKRLDGYTEKANSGCASGVTKIAIK